MGSSGRNLAGYFPDVITPFRFGAVGDGVTDDGAALQAFFDALSAAGSQGAGSLSGHTFLANRALTFTDAGQTITGDGDRSTIKAGAAMAALLSVTSTAGRSQITGIRFDGNGLATNAVVQSVAVETSIGTRWTRCKFRGATGFQMVNQRCEDVTYLDCSTDGDESNPTSIPHALQVVVPNGMVRIIGGEWFGRCDLSYQQIGVQDAVIGPIFINNAPNSTATILKLSGCYIYDGGVDNDNCIGTGTNLGNISADGCYLIASKQANFVNGNMGNVAIRFLDCIFIQGAGLPANPVSYIVQASGVGKVIIDGGNSSLAAGGLLHAFNAVGGATTVVTTLVACVGVS
jgi:hypothetical protein